MNRGKVCGPAAVEVVGDVGAPVSHELVTMATIAIHGIKLRPVILPGIPPNIFDLSNLASEVRRPLRRAQGPSVNNLLPSEKSLEPVFSHPFIGTNRRALEPPLNLQH